jgi:hypothetical protein
VLSRSSIAIKMRVLMFATLACQLLPAALGVSPRKWREAAVLMYKQRVLVQGSAISGQLYPGKADRKGKFWESVFGFP